MNELINVFIEERRGKYAANSVLAYERDLLSFSAYFSERGITRPEKITLEDARKYGDYLTFDMTGTSIKRRMSVIRNFYKYLIEKGICSKNPFVEFKTNSIDLHEMAILTRKEVDVLLAQPDIMEYKGIRDKAMLELLYATGMRVSEMLSLNVSDINFGAGIVICRSGKHERTIALYPIAFDCLKRYINVSRPLLNPKPDSDALFLNTGGNRMSRQGFWKILKSYAYEAGIHQNISPHTLRHSFAAHLLENGADAKDVQEIMGNVGTATIKEYIKYLKVKSKDDLIRHHPRAKNY